MPGLTFHYNPRPDTNPHRHHVTSYDFRNETAVREGNEILQQNIDPTEPHEGTFNDLAVYQNLLNRPGCIQVDLAGVTITRNNYILGLQSEYRVTMDDGRQFRESGPNHKYENGLYARQDLGHGNRIVQSLQLSEDEYLVGMQVMEGEILDGIQFVTSSGRQIYIGGYGGDINVNYTSDRPIIALAGTYKGVVHSIGYYTTKPDDDSWLRVWFRRLLEHVETWIHSDQQRPAEDRHQQNEDNRLEGPEQRQPRNEDLPDSTTGEGGRQLYNDICVCFEPIRQEMDGIVIFICGHAMHNACHQGHIANTLDHGNYKCPWCRRDL